MMYVQHYNNGKGHAKVKITGTSEEFEGAEIPAEDADPYQSHGVEKLVLRVDEGSDEAIEFEQKAEAYNKAQDDLVNNMRVREYVGQLGINGKMLAMAINTWPANEKVQEHLLREAGGLDKKQSRTLIQMMFNEGLVDGESYLTVKGIEEFKDIAEFMEGWT